MPKFENSMPKPLIKSLSCGFNVKKKEITAIKKHVRQQKTIKSD